MTERFTFSPQLLCCSTPKSRSNLFVLFQLPEGTEAMNRQPVVWVLCNNMSAEVYFAALWEVIVSVAAAAAVVLMGGAVHVERFWEIWEVVTGLQNITDIQEDFLRLWSILNARHIWKSASQNRFNLYMKAATNELCFSYEQIFMSTGNVCFSVLHPEMW